MVAATGVLVAAAFYVINLRAQNRNRQAQLFMNMYQNYTSPEAMKLSYDWEYAKIDSYKDYVNMWQNKESYIAAGYWQIYYEGVGSLVRSGLIDIGLVANFLSTEVKIAWERVGPYILEFRKVNNYPRFFVEFEYLYDRMMSYCKDRPEYNLGSPNARERYK